MNTNNEYKTVCDHCGGKTYYETEQPCHRTITPVCPTCGNTSHMDPIPCPGTLRVIDNSDLDARFTPYYQSGERIEITYSNGEKVRCYVGKSTGWKPIYLEILKSNNTGGGSLMTHEITSIRGLNKYR